MTLPLQPNRDLIRDALIRSELQALTEEQVEMDRMRDYFDGEQPLTFATDEFMAVFGDAFDGFSDNWCKVVINAVNDRLKLLGVKLKEDEGGEIATEIWEAMQLNDIDEQQVELHEGILVEGRAYVIVWPGETEGTVMLDWQPGQLCRVFYDPDNRRKSLWAVKRWQTDFGEVFVTFYTPEAVYKFKQTSASDPNRVRSQSSPSALTEIPGISGGFSNLEPRNVPGEPFPLVNPFGIVPVVEFNNVSYRSEIKDTIPQQDAINKTMLDMMIAGEFAADPQRWVETLANAPVGGWKSSPGEVWQFTPSFDADGKHIPVQANQFETMDPSNYTQVVSMWLQHVANTSSTPVRYFVKDDRGGRGDAPSGESLLVDDKPLNDKVERRQTFIGNRWMQVIRLVAQGIGITNAQGLLGEPIWEDPRHDYRMSLIAEGAAMVQMGIPLEFAVTKIGLTQDEVDILMPMLEEAQAEQEAKEAAELEAQMNRPAPASSADA